MLLKGHSFEANENGEIIIPFTSEPKQESIIILAGDLACLTSFNHQQETYKLVAGISLDRESLIPSSVCKVLIRPQLFLNSTQLSLNNDNPIKYYSCTISLNTVDSPVSKKEIPIPNQAYHDKDIEVEFIVPNYLESVSVVFNICLLNQQGQAVNLNQEKIYTVNGSRSSYIIQDSHLRLTAKGYKILILGKNGEAQIGAHAKVSLQHVHFKSAISFDVESNELGEIELGKLRNIQAVYCKIEQGGERRIWNLKHSLLLSTPPKLIHAYSDEAIYIPVTSFIGEIPKLCTLVQVENKQTIRGFTQVLKYANEYLFISPNSLPSGQYELRWKDTSKKPILIRTVNRATSNQVGNWVVTPNGLLEMSNWVKNPIRLGPCTFSDNRLKIVVENATDTTRFHVVCTQFQPEFTQFEQLQASNGAAPGFISTTTAQSYFTSGRELGDEYRYIIDRKYIKQFPHLLLEKPTLLSVPYAKREVKPSQGMAAGGNEFNTVGASNARHQEIQSIENKSANAYNSQVCIDFLSKQSLTFTNLKINKRGYVSVRTDALKANGGWFVQVIAVDETSIFGRNLLLSKQGEEKMPTRNLGLTNILNPSSHFLEKSQISLVPAKGATLAFTAGIEETNHKIYDSLSKLYKFYATIADNADVHHFAFIGEWATYPINEKLRLYEANACHELNFFLYEKDNEFFRSHVMYFIQLKRQKTFLDYYLLDDTAELKKFTQPWRLNTLNKFEKILLAIKLQLTMLLQQIKDEAISFLGNNQSTNLELGVNKINQSNFHKALYMQNIATTSTAVGNISSFSGKAPFILRKNVRQLSSSSFRNFNRSRSNSPVRRNRRTSICRMDSCDFLPTLKRRTSICMESNLCLSEDDCNSESDDCVSLAHSVRAIPVQQQPTTSNNDNNNQFIKQTFFQKPKETVEYEEHHYYKHSGQSKANAIETNLFWFDLCTFLEPKIQSSVNSTTQTPGANDNDKFISQFRGFLSSHVADISTNFTSILFALSVIDLPFQPSNHAIKLNDRGVIQSIESGSEFILFHKEVIEYPAFSPSTDISVVQCIYAAGSDNLLSPTDPLQVHTHYRSRVVIMNSSANNKEIEILFQIPESAIPLGLTKSTSTTHRVLAGYTTQILEYSYYFPNEGNYQQFPVHVSFQGAPIATSETRTFQVTFVRSNIVKNWNYISRYGTDQEILSQLITLNTFQNDVRLIQWRMANKEFYKVVLDILEKRMIFCDALWSWSVHHLDVPRIKQYLENYRELRTYLGPSLKCSLVEYGWNDKEYYAHREYDPLITSRAHQLGARRKLLNDGLREQYCQFIRFLCFEKEISLENRLSLVYYLLLMNRQSEADELFSEINWSDFASKLTAIDQYFICYFHYLRGNVADAKTLANQYAQFPVKRVASRFSKLLEQILQLESNSNDIFSSSDFVFSLAPSISFNIEGKNIAIHYQNLSSLSINYYKMDIEFLFTTNPFLYQNTQISEVGKFSYVKPTATYTIALPENEKFISLEINKDFQASNIIIELAYDGVYQSLPYFANSMTVHFAENYGKLRVISSDNAPISTTYVKVYAKTKSGSNSFYKDGYTDPRGVFDYVSVTDDDRLPVRFSFLIPIVMYLFNFFSTECNQIFYPFDLQG